MIAKPDIDFQTDYIIRYGSGLIAFSNSAINFVIYVVQMKDFRKFLGKLFRGRSAVNYQESFFAGMQEATGQPYIEMSNLQPRNGILQPRRQ